MTPDEIKWRRCQVPDCKYREPRGSSEGHFIAGHFVCSDHYEMAADVAHIATWDEMLVIASQQKKGEVKP